MSSTQAHIARRFEGQVAIVTGAGGGIGSAVAHRLAAEGAAVVANDLRPQAADDVAARITEAGGRAVAHAADVSRADEVDALFEAALEAFDDVTVLVNNAGLIGQTCHLLDSDDAWWDRLIATNLRSVYLCSVRAARIMAERRGGAIVSSSSGGAVRAHRGEAAYDASKGGIEAATRAFALDLAPYGIRVNAVAPGSIDVAPAGSVSDEVLRSRGTTVPLGRVGVPADLAATYAFLASPEAAYITGVVVPVDGGMLAQQRSPQVDIFGLDRYPRLGSAAVGAS
jgi:NAD(P)-dependent dehydrogenase (short-subunit alcohol dehydrogenase family)